MIQVSNADLVEAYNEVFSTQAGQIVLADLLRKFGFTSRSTLPDHAANTNIMLMNEGARMVLVHIDKRMNTDPNLAENEHVPEV